MRTVLIADRNVAFANDLADRLSATGIHSIVCPGPFPPVLRCIRCDVGYCPLTEGADAMVYEADLEGKDDHGQRYNLAMATMEAHPEVPMILTWHTPARPECVVGMLDEGDRVRAVPPDERTIVHELELLLNSSR